MKAHGERLAWIDAAKGLGILLVVAGHVDPAGALGRAVYAFHMPLFFVLAGAAFSPRPFRETLVRRARALLVPYVAFLALAAAAFPADWRSLVYGGAALSGPFAVFWFPTALFLSVLLHEALRRAARGRAVPLALLALACAALGTLLPGKTPLAAGVAPVGAAFLWFGAAAVGRAGPGPRTAAVAAAFLAAYLGALAAGQVPWEAFDMKRAVYGPPLLGLVAAASASIVLARALVLAASRAKGLTRAFAWLGEASMSVMFLHQPVRFALDGLVPPWPGAVLSVAAGAAFHLAASRWRPARMAFLGSRD